MYMTRIVFYYTACKDQRDEFTFLSIDISVFFSELSLDKIRNWNAPWWDILEVAYAGTFISKLM